MLITMTNKETGKETNLETSSLIVLQKALDWLDVTQEEKELPELHISGSLFDKELESGRIGTESNRQDLEGTWRTLTKQNHVKKESGLPSTLPAFLAALISIGEIHGEN